MNPFIEQYQDKYKDAVDYLKHEMGNIRTGRATPALIEDVMVTCYGTKSPLKQVASVQVADAKTLVVEAWDKSITKDIEKSIASSDMGLNPTNEGNLLRIVLPQLTTERREALIKIIHEKAEESRIKIRQVRDKIREDILEAEKNKDITEDDKYLYFKQTDEKTKEYTKSVDDIIESKEKELREI